MYVSALHVGGVADDVLAGARAGQFQLFISLPILQELERVLVGKLKWAPGRAKEAISAVRELAALVIPLHQDEAFCLGGGRPFASLSRRLPSRC